jgi:PE-PPE domain
MLVAVLTFLRVGIPYPASFWPIPLPGWCPNLSCDTWNVSVGTGIQNLDATLRPLLTDPNAQITLFGYSQGGAVVSQELYNLADLPQSEKDQIQVVTIGNIDNPQGLAPTTPSNTTPSATLRCTS